MVGGGAWSKFRVAVRTREIYCSANGDRWLLARDPNAGRVFVRHEPNLPSGGQVSYIAAAFTPPSTIPWPPTAPRHSASTIWTRSSGSPTPLATWASRADLPLGP